MRNSCLIYNDGYCFDLFGLEKLHPFDAKKYSRIWNSIKHLNLYHLKEFDRFKRKDLMLVHSKSYIEAVLSDPNLVFSILEFPLAGWIPKLFYGKTNSILRKSILGPMLMASAGTFEGAKYALKNNALSVNLGGGFHHATKSRGHGFCVFSDIAISIQKIRSESIINENDKILIIDLDAHQSDGIERIFKDDKNIVILDMFNKDLFPQDDYAKKRIDICIELSSGCSSDVYLNLLVENINKINFEDFKLIFYIAGTDIYQDDQLGKLGVSAEGIIKRDEIVLRKAEKYLIPTVMVLAGGYTFASADIVTNSLKSFFTKTEFYEQ